MKFSNYSILAMIVFCATAARVNAATIDLTLNGDTSDISGSGTSTIALTLTNSDTGTVPAFSLSTGDTINVHVMLNNSITMPNNAYYGSIELVFPPSNNEANSYSYSVDQTVSLYNHDAPVSLPSGYTPFTGGGGQLLLGTMSFPTPTPSFSFDEIVFNAHLSFINGAQNSVTIPGGSPYLDIQGDGIAHSSTAPLPSTLSLLLSSLLGLAFFSRKVT